MSSFILQNQYGLSAIQYSWQIIYVAAAIFFSGLLNYLLVERLGIKRMVFLGSICMSLGGLLLIYHAQYAAYDLYGAMFSITLFCLGAGLTFINAFAGAFEEVATMAGLAGMMYAFLQDSIAAMSSYLIASYKAQSLTLLAMVLIGVGFCAIIALRFTNESKNYYLLERA